ncbi:hypothetical protein MBLNU230_g1420t1 [Neophaeotheca triangularis]
MPLGFERLNERTQRPNSNINFIKPLPGPDSATSQDFLSRIAAQCFPIMQKNYISLMSLEEYAPNPEFLGRNFNAGEVIQLVLKDKQGRWLSFKFVQMVMMHELAHCKEMNHGRGFWKVRNAYAEEMQWLWKRKYVGEGLWGRGKGLGSGRFEHDRVPQGEDVPEHLCGGTYRRARGRKRKRGEGAKRERAKETYAERQQKRIQRKFGKHGGGNALGDDELVRGGLEKKNHAGKPRVAQSKRGRELRAAAALARFDAAKQATPEHTPELDEDDGSETEWSGSDDGPSVGGNGKKVVDGKGHDMVRVCGDEEESEGGQDEMDELRALSAGKKSQPTSNKAGNTEGARKQDNDRFVTLDDSETESEDDSTGASNLPPPTKPTANAIEPPPSKPFHITPVDGSETESEPESPKQPPSTNEPNPAISNFPKKIPAPPATNNPTTTPTPQSAQPSESTSNNNPAPSSCPICSLENAAESTLCLACSHVLKPSLVRGSWRCGSETCKGTGYVNPGDAGRCGICQGPRGAVGVAVKGGMGSGGSSGGSRGRGIGVVGAEVLRWD